MGRLGPQDHLYGVALDADRLAAKIADELDGRDILWAGDEWWIDGDGSRAAEIELTHAPDEPMYTQRVRVRIKVEILAP